MASFTRRSHMPHDSDNLSISGLVVKSIVAIDGPRVRFTADASFCLFWLSCLAVF
ncbi:hypothetical protein GGS24DRAFT_485850 [Hypoxylon argillaceum]|nr:hypothetical protein GGS24DRAFT_485850 [Hypoxylon argillaceum]